MAGTAKLVQHATSRRRSRVQTTFVPLAGGLNLMSSEVEKPPGELNGALNYECDEVGNYRAIHGIERFSGLPSPSAAMYVKVEFEQGQTGAVSGDRVQSTSGGTGTLVADQVITSGSTLTGDARGYYIITPDDGANSFPKGEGLVLNPGAANGIAGLIVVDGQDLGETDRDLHRTYLGNAQDLRRMLIGPVPGDGDVKGVWGLKGELYAFRFNATINSDLMYKATPTGWELQELGERLYFSGGQVGRQFIEDRYYVGQASGAQAEVKRVVLESGDWTTNDAAGFVVLYNRTGVFQAGEGLQRSGLTALVATTQGTVIAQELGIGRKYEFVNYNFYSRIRDQAMYGASGGARAFEFDGATFTTIFSDPDDNKDKPDHIAAIHDKLFLSHRTYVRYSDLENPLVFGVLGAGQFPVGDDVIGLEPEVGGVLAVLSKNRKSILRGKTEQTYVLEHYSRDSGAIEWSIQRMGTLWFLDDRGISTIAATDRFGDFSQNAISQKVDPIIEGRRRDVSTSVRVRTKNQYRIYFKDGSGLTTTMYNNKPIGIMPFKLPKIFTACCSMEDARGDEQLFGASEDGYVYHLDSGNSFDGQPIEGYLRTTNHHYGTPAHTTVFRGILFEIESGGFTDMWCTPQFDYAGPQYPAAPSQFFELQGQGGAWGEAIWGDFVWGGEEKGAPRIRIDGVGKNMSVHMYYKRTVDPAHTLRGMTVEHATRSLVR